MIKEKFNSLQFFLCKAPKEVHFNIIVMMFSACQKRLCQDLDHRLFWSNFHAYKHAEDQWKCRAFQMKQTRFYLAKFRMPLFLCSTGYGASCYRLRTDWRCLSACAVSQMVQAQHRSFLQHVLTLKLYSYSMCIWWTNCAYCCAMCCIVCGEWSLLHPRPCPCSVADVYLKLPVIFTRHQQDPLNLFIRTGLSLVNHYVWRSCFN